MNYEGIKKVILIGVLAIAALAVWQGYVHKNEIGSLEVKGDNLKYRNVTIKDLSIRAELVSSDYLREKGLSGRRKLSATEGMLFVFPESGYHAIWMKEMNFPLDIIWVDNKYQIVGIAKNTTPETYPKTFKPSLPASYVLEINAGIADQYNLKPGDQVFFEL
jgi:uncharacterized membrane protein (UPF0127 family)